MRVSPYRSREDRLLFSGIRAQNLHPSLVGDPADMAGTCGFRIPSLLYLEGADVLLAATDRSHEGADWGYTGVALRRSADRGLTWSSPLSIPVLPPVSRAPQAVDDWHSAFYIDPVLLEDRSGAVHLLLDFFPESKGFHRPDWLEPGSGFEHGRIRLCDGPPPAEGKGAAGPVYTVDEAGWVVAPGGVRTRYYLPPLHSGAVQFQTLGDMYYAVGEPDWLDAPPPLLPPEPGEGRDIYVGNIFLNIGKPAFDPAHPVFVRKRLAGPGPEADVPSAYEAVETSPAPLRAAVCMHLVQLTSRDGGVTWSQPRFLTPAVKDEDCLFLGTGPGVGLRLRHQPDDRKNGRLMVPVYKPGQAGLLLSDDDGVTWRRGGYIPTVDEAQAVELNDGTVLVFGRQDEPGDTPMTVSRDGGDTWEPMTHTGLQSVRCQKSVVAYPAGDPRYPCVPGMIPGRQYLLASHPTGQRRGGGVVTLGEVLPDGTLRWLADRPLGGTGQYDQTEQPDFFAYSCLAVLPNGQAGVLFEPQPTNCVAFARFDIRWFFDDRKEP